MRYSIACLLDKAKGLLRRSVQDVYETKKSEPRGFSLCRSLGNPVWTQSSYTALTEAGYHDNPVVYHCVQKISRNIASVPLVMIHQDTQERVHDHAVLSLLKRPNNRQSGYEFISDLVSYLLLSGNAYVQGIKNEEGVIEELHLLRPDRMRVVPTSSYGDVSYYYTVDGKTEACPDADSILHIKMFNPLNDWYGMSPLQPAKRSVDLHNAISGYNLSFIQNGGRPSGILMVNTKYDLLDHERQRIQDELKDMYQGPKNAGRIALLEGDFSFQEMGKAPKDCDFNEGKSNATQEIEKVFGLHRKDQEFSHYREARYHFWQETLLPLLDRIIANMNHWLVQPMDAAYTLSYHKDDIPALTEYRDLIWERMNDATFLTLNEKREALGYVPVEEGDTLKDYDL